MKTPKRDPKKIPFFLGPLVLQFCSMPHEIILYIEYIYVGYHQKGLCKGYVLEWNIAQNLQKRR